MTAAATSPTTDALLVRLHRLAPGDAGRAATRAQVIDEYPPMSVWVARRFGGRGEPMADLTQVAAIGLINAVDRFDPARGVAFSSYAIPTMVGEIKRYFRDAGWTAHVPRHLQELAPRRSAAVDHLTQALHRSPTTREVAPRLGVSPDQVFDSRRSAHAYRPWSLEQPVHGTRDMRLIDLLSEADSALEAVDRRETLRRALASLPARERRVVGLRFVGEMSRAQIAARVGVSQMQVSRLLTRSLIRLRAVMEVDEVAASGAGHVVDASCPGDR
ncbi:SigB/SigF/SigG family RNA polymerase sigma factor [Actinoplanes subtropicus]|uniref:SigB/SigF/SigG family RNA polymerase sigma factor n=1 Tax=Actinoplanes subtropicus TaxID=543632 RepID=UPI00068C7FAF|nr:SigB/SigF/SigG family RNA polymerase sigma factor [Actinoplanes subtropicus]